MVTELGLHSRGFSPLPLHLLPISGLQPSSQLAAGAGRDASPAGILCSCRGEQLGSTNHPGPQHLSKCSVMSKVPSNPTHFVIPWFSSPTGFRTLCAHPRPGHVSPEAQKLERERCWCQDSADFPSYFFTAPWVYPCISLMLQTSWFSCCCPGTQGGFRDRVCWGSNETRLGAIASLSPHSVFLRTTFFNLCWINSMGLCTQRSSNYPLGLCFLKGNELGTVFPLERCTGAIASRFLPVPRESSAPAAPRRAEGAVCSPGGCPHGHGGSFCRNKLINKSWGPPAQRGPFGLGRRFEPWEGEQSLGKEFGILCSRGVDQTLGAALPNSVGHPWLCSPFLQIQSPHTALLHVTACWSGLD